VTLRVAVDFGTSSTCVVVSVDGGEPQVVMVEGGSPVMPSAVFAAVDGTLFVGQEAERQAAIDPARYEPNPKRRIDEGELLLGDTVLSVADVVRAVLTRAVDEARRVAGGGQADLLVLTHPADWGAVRTRVLRQAGNGLATDIVLVPEPVAAAVFHAARYDLPDGSALAVLDVGGGTVDVSVVRRQAAEAPGSGARSGQGAGTGFRVLATHGDPNFGGADIDQLLLDHIGETFTGPERLRWQALMDGQEMSDRRRRRMLRQDVRGAKETLSRHTYTDVPLPQPFPDAHVTRADLETLLAEPLGRAAQLTADTIGTTGLRPDQLAAVFLVGGSSRIPLIARLVHERTGIMPTTLDAPETVVCRGALRAVTLDPLRTGGLAAQRAVTAPRLGLPRTGPRPLSSPTPGSPLGSPPVGSAPLGSAKAPSTSPSAQLPPARYPAAGAGAAGPLPVYLQPGPPTLSSPTRPKRGHARLFGVAGALVVVAAAVAGVLVYLHPGSPATPNPSPTTGSTAGSTSGPAQPGKLVAQYDYRFTAPSGWSQSGGDASQLKVQVAPGGSATAPQAIYVQEFRLTYNSTTNRSLAVGQLRQLVNNNGYQDFNSNLNYAGRTVVYYRELAGEQTVDWYVLFQGTVQVSVGCQYPNGSAGGIDTACRQVVNTMIVTS
jgi:type VII secretion-associated protein (TIGR03931 family)